MTRRLNNGHWGARAVAAWTGYAGRRIAFSLAAASIHLAVLRWIFLRIGT